RILGPQRFPAEAEAIHDTRPEALEQDIGRSDQTAEDRLSLLRLEVDRHALLIPVEEQERRADIGLAPERRRSPRRVAPPGLLDLDHLGVEVGEQKGTVRSGEETGEIEKPKARERPSHGPIIESAALFGAPLRGADTQSGQPTSEGLSRRRPRRGSD